MSTAREPNEVSRVANVGGSDIPCPDVGEHTSYQYITCYIHVYAGATIHTANATPRTEPFIRVGSYKPPRPSLAGIGLESLKRRRPGKTNEPFLNGSSESFGSLGK
jgi:hypothetical protein